jgi:hypothetical protein
MYKVIKISKSEFEGLNHAQKLFTDEHANNFKLVKLQDNYSFAFSYNENESIDPIIMNLIEFNKILIGFSSFIIMISKEKGNVCFRIGLHETIMGIEKFSSGFLAITETTITQINACHNSCTSFHLVPDIILDYKINLEKKQVLIKSVSGGDILIDF